MNQSSFNVLRSAVLAPGTIITNLTLIAIVIGFEGNEKVGCFLVQRRDLRKVPHFLLASLAVNGIISSVFSLPSRLAMLAFVGLDRIDYAKPAFYIMISSSFLCAVVNSVTLSLMAIDRQDCVLCPFNRRMTPSNVKFMIAGKWIGALFLTSILFFIVFFDPSTLSPETFFSKLSDLKHNPIFICYIMGKVINVFTLIIVIVTAIRVIKTIRSSTLPDAASLHRRQENKLTWLTYKISGVCVACWVPQFICAGLLASDFVRDVVVNAMVIISTIGHYNYVLNPLVYRDILNRKGNNVPRQANRRSVLTGVSAPSCTQE